jgi:hypothetical protein
VWYFLALPPTSSFSAMNTPENTNDDADVPEQAVEGDIQMKYSSDLAVQPKCKSSK